MDIQRILADNMRRYRKETGLSQDALAHECDLHRTYISGIERCVRNPTVMSINKIARALDVQAWQLLKEDTADPKTEGEGETVS